MIGLTVALPRLLGAQAGGVSGDVYVTTNGGEIRRVPARDVVLVPKSFVDRILVPACRHSDSIFFAKSNAPAISAAEALRVATQTLANPMPDTTITRLRVSLDSASARRGKTNIDGHYRIENIRPGEYVIFAHQYFGSSQHVRWLVPFTARAGQSATVDLDPSNFDSVTLLDEFCGLLNRKPPNP